MENQNSATKIMLIYGAILSGISILVNLINYSFGNVYKPHWAIGIVSFLLMIAVIVYGIKSFKDGNNGFLSLGQAIKIGLGISLISAIIGIMGESGEGMVGLCFNAPLAKMMVARLLGIEPAELGDDDCCDGIGELVNMISGRSKTALSENTGQPFRMSLPTIIKGSRLF